eukprot:764923-Hanusia_phi.AAC.3
MSLDVWGSSGYTSQIERNDFFWLSTICGAHPSNPCPLSKPPEIEQSNGRGRPRERVRGGYVCDDGQVGCDCF